MRGLVEGAAEELREGSRDMSLSTIETKIDIGYPNVPISLV